MPTYDSATQAAQSLIARKGAALTLTRYSAVSVDPVTQVPTTPADTAYTFRAVGLPPSPSASFKIGSLENRNIERLFFGMKDAEVTPAPQDKVRWKGYDWTLIHCTVYDPAGDGVVLVEAYAER